MGVAIANTSADNQPAWPMPSAMIAGRPRTISTTDSGMAIPALSRARGSNRSGLCLRKESQMPAAPSPSIATEIDTKAKWYQRTTLSNRVTATS